MVISLCTIGLYFPIKLGLLGADNVVIEEGIFYIFLHFSYRNIKYRIDKITTLFAEGIKSWGDSNSQLQIWG